MLVRPRGQCSNETRADERRTRSESARRREELVKWDHVEMSRCGTSVILRNVRSTAPRGAYSQEKEIGGMSRTKEAEMVEENKVINGLEECFGPTIRPGSLKEEDEGEKEGKM